MYIKTFNTYISEDKFIHLDNVDINNENKLFESFLTSMVRSIKDIDIKRELKDFIDTNSINEGFFDKLKDRFPKASKVSNDISDKGAKVLGKIIQGAKDLTNFVSKLKNGIKEFFTKVLDNTRDKVISELKSGKLSDKIKNLNDKEKDGLKTDIKTGREVTKWYSKSFLDKITNSTDKNLTNFLEKEQQPITESMINESMINEKSNVISTLVHGIEEIPPFSWLAKVAKAGEAGANKLIDLLSKITEKMGGPKFHLPVIATLIGIVFEQLIKGQSGHWLLDLVGSGTPLGLAIKGIKVTALVIACILAIDSIIGDKILGKH